MSWNSELVWTFLILFWWQNVFNRIESWIKWRCLFWLQEEDVCWKILISSNSGKIFVPDPKECHDMIKYLTKGRGKKMTDYASEKIHVSFVFLVKIQMTSSRSTRCQFHHHFMSSFSKQVIFVSIKFEAGRTR